MPCSTVMNELKSLGTSQNVKIFKRHGAGNKLYGVSFANLYKLRKKIKTDHNLAMALWKTGNYDARLLATMIADPGAAAEKLLDRWVKDLDCYTVTDLFAGSFASKTRFAEKKMKKWTAARVEWTGRAGWVLLATQALSDKIRPDSYYQPYLATIEKRIHESKNRIRDAMINALIAIGMRSANLKKKAIAAAKGIGKVEVDHGETGCKTPDAIEYLKRVGKRRKR